jgi:hypothetical protein
MEMLVKIPRLLPLLLVPLLLPAQNLKEVEKRVTEFTLPNGMSVIGSPTSAARTTRPVKAAWLICLST